MGEREGEEWERGLVRSAREGSEGLKMKGKREEQHRNKWSTQISRASHYLPIRQSQCFPAF